MTKTTKLSLCLRAVMDLATTHWRPQGNIPITLLRRLDSKGLIELRGDWAASYGDWTSRREWRKRQ